MATTTGPDLSPARRAVEALMDDTCQVIRPGSETLDEATGSLVAAPAQLVYSLASLGENGRALNGRCKISVTSSAMTRESGDGGARQVTRFYQGSVPWDAPEVREGDLWTHTSSRRDPQLVGHTFTVREVFVSTFLVGRRMALELRR